MSFENDMSMVLSALAFAADMHRDQRRKDREASPYINHPIALASILHNEGGVRDPIVITAAILHDTVEDTRATFEDIDRQFGPEVGSVVREVTDDKSLPKDERKRLQVEHAKHASERAKLVKLADKISNLRDLSSAPPAKWDLARKQEYFDWAKSVVDGVRGVNGALEAAFDDAFAKRP